MNTTNGLIKTDLGTFRADLAALALGTRPLSVATIERGLSGLVGAKAQHGMTLDRGDRHLASVLAGIRRRHVRPPAQKEAVLAEDIITMVRTLPHDLRGMADRATLLLGYAGGRAGQRSWGLRPATTNRPTAAAGSRSSRGARCGRGRQDWLARGRDRPRLVRAYLPCALGRVMAAFAADHFPAGLQPSLAG